MLYRNPSHFIDRDVWKHFPKPYGVHHGVVTKVVSQNEPRWDISYDDGDSEHYDIDDMIKYCIKLVDGASSGVIHDKTIMMN